MYNNKENDMNTFKKMVTRNGQVRFFKDKKAVKPDEVPAEVHALLAGNETKEVKYKEVSSADKTGPVSVISGEPATHKRFLNGKSYWLTREEYQKYSLGELAQAIREAAIKDKNYAR